MHKRAPDHSKEHEAKVDLTPMIDMVFLLVMFFVLTSQFSMRLPEILLPVAFETQKPPDNVGKQTVLVISIRKLKDVDRTAEIVFSGQVMKPDELREALRREAKFDEEINGLDPDSTKDNKISKLQVRIRADEGIQGQYLRQVFDACQKAGIWKLKLSALEMGND